MGERGHPLLKILIVGLFTFSAPVSAGAPPKQQKKSAADFRIESIEANLFYRQTGTWSKNVLDGKFVLLNTVIGEGDAEGPSDTMLIKVKVTGERPAGKASPKVSVRMRELGAGKKKTLLVDKTVEAYLDDSHVNVLPFLISFGCNPLEVSAEIADKHSPGGRKSLKSTIPLACGE